MTTRQQTQVQVAYLTGGGRHGYLVLPVTTEYERIEAAYPNREPRFCHPEYHHGRERDNLLAVWQREVDGREDGRYGLPGLDPVEPAPKEELERLSREITAALDEIHVHPDQHPEAAEYLASCAEYGEILREIDRPYLEMETRSPDAELRAAESVIGNRDTCTREEMAGILRASQPVADQGHDVDWWADACRGITLISISRGCIRYDQPGQLAGGRKGLMFAPSDLDVSDHWAERIVRVVD